jgi:geranylgeranyl reductase family protein
VSERFDAIVIGAGPAGSSCARRAAELGLKVVVLEKSAFPRPKPCGAGLTDRALPLMNGDESAVEHGRFNTVEIAFGRHLSLFVGCTYPLVVTTTRRELDAHLAGLAESAGARIDFGRAATAIEEGDSEVRVSAGADTLKASRVVVADGPRGAGRAMLGLSPVPMGGGLYVHAFPASGGERDGPAEVPVFDPAAARGGYGWVFPKRDHLNVGVFSQRALDAGMKRELEAFLELRGLAGWRTEGPFAFPIPVGRPRDALGTDRVLFAGDAAGLTNPITGEGISSAILSGRIAAEAVAGSDGGEAPPSTYARRVRDEVVPLTDGSKFAGEFVYRLGPGVIDFVARTPVLRSLIGPFWRAASRRRPELSFEIVTHGERGGRA